MGRAVEEAVVILCLTSLQTHLPLLVNFDFVQLCVTNATKEGATLIYFHLDEEVINVKESVQEIAARLNAPITKS